MDNFVVYAYVRSGPDRFGRMGTFYYIGKGKPERPFQCSKGSRRIKCPRDRKNNILILHSNLDEQTAFEYEKRLIQFYGRVNTTDFGVLRNLTDGGEGTSGMSHSLETKNKMSIDRTGEKNSFYGRVHSEEIKDSKRIHFDLYHPDHGEYKNTTFEEMRQMFPGVFINRSKVLNVANELSNSYKGWVLLKNKEVYLSPKKVSHLKNYFTWVHKDYGKHENLSIVDLRNKFPELNLDSSSLSRVSRGEQNSHKGWNTDKNPETVEMGRRGRVYKWTHKEYGDHCLTLSKLVKKFEQQNLQPSCLSWVINKKAKHHKGWSIRE